MKKSIYVTLVVLLFISSAFFFLQNQILNQKVATLNSKIYELEKQIQQAENKLPEGWKEYIDEKYRFKIWYPAGVDKEIVIYKLNNNTYSLVSFYPDNSPSNDIPSNLLTVYIYNQNITDIKKFIPEEIKERRGVMIDNNIDQYLTQIKVYGINAYKYESSDDFVNYYIKRGNSVFVLTFDNISQMPEASTELRPYFDQMVKSFQFID